MAGSDMSGVRPAEVSESDVGYVRELRAAWLDDLERTLGGLRLGPALAAPR
jgi:hypothetical protein